MKEGKIRKFDDTMEQTDRHTVQRLRPLYPLWILEGAGQLLLLFKTDVPQNFLTIVLTLSVNKSCRKISYSLSF